MESNETSFWRKCSVCKKPIGFKAKYYLCSVSTCNGLRTGYTFCSMQCFDAHLPGARHRDAGAVEKVAPNAAEAQAQAQSSQDQAAPKRVLVNTPQAGGAAKSQSTIPKETLVVVSKVKDYIRARSEMNTSDALMAVLSDRIREICDQAIDAAREDGRKTVLDRDVKRERR